MTKKWEKKVPKRAPSPPKTWSFISKNCLFLLKNTSQPRKKLKFCKKKWPKNDKKVPPKEHPAPQKPEVLHEKLKIVLPMGILKKKSPPPQLHQIFKPIRKFFCTFLPIYQFKLRTPLKHIKVPKKYKTKKCITFTPSLTSLHFTSLTSTIDLGESYRGRYRRQD